MNLTELKQKTVPELLDIAREMGIDNLARSRKQDIIFAILKKHAKSGEDIYGDSVLEILQDGFGFLRSADSSYLAGPDDIYVSPSQIRRFNLRKGDSISGKMARPKRASATLPCSKLARSTLTARNAAMDSLREPDAAVSPSVCAWRSATGLLKTSLLGSLI